MLGAATTGLMQGIGNELAGYMLKELDRWRAQQHSRSIQETLDKAAADPVAVFAGHFVPGGGRRMRSSQNR